MFAYAIQGKNIMITIDGHQHVVNKDSHINFDDIQTALKEQRYDDVRQLIDPSLTIAKYADGRVEIKNGHVFYQSRKVNSTLSKRLIDMHKSGFPADPLINFLDNVYQNPSARSVEGLYEFLERNKMAISPDGCFYGFKRVNKDFTDCYTSKIDNSVGQTVEMPRNAVDDDFHNTCSRGLHICSMDYLRHSGFGGSDSPIVLCKINPKDVVAFPEDYNFTKARVCKYVVESVFSHTDTTDDDLGLVVSTPAAPPTPPVDPTSDPADDAA